MELKDWIIMIVPIMANGLLLFIFQQKILMNQKRIERKNSYQHEICIKFLSLLQEFYTAFRNIQDIDEERSGKQVSFADVWNPAADIMNQLIVYNETHPLAIKKVSTQFQRCRDKWQEMIENLFKDRKRTGIISEEGAIKFSNEYEKMDSLIKECLAQCEKQILKL